MTRSRQYLAFRMAAVLAAGSALAACAPVVGPYQQQASNAAYACQQGIQQACYDYQYIAPVANAEAVQAQQDATVGTAVAAGVLGAVAGAAIASSVDDGYYYRGNRYYYGPRHYGPRYYGPRYHRHWR